MIFYPSCILAIENESDRNFMMEIYAEYRDLMYYKISLVARGRKDEWEDILHDTAAALCDHIDTMRRLNRPRLTSYVVTAAENQAKNFLRYQDRHKRVSFEEALDGPDPLEGGGAEEEHAGEAGQGGDQLLRGGAAGQGMGPVDQGEVGGVHAHRPTASPMSRSSRAGRGSPAAAIMAG